MNLTDEHVGQLKHFFETSAFATQGAIITDLDGTAVHEVEGRTVIHTSVELGLKTMKDLGRPIIINTLRFPLSVIRTFANDWYVMSGAPIPCILLNGSHLGYIQQVTANEFRFETLQCFTLEASEIIEVMQGIRGMVKDGIKNLLLFFYTADWQQGEQIWTPDATAIQAVADKYKSASKVFHCTLDELEQTLLAQPQCMLFLLINEPQDRLMAYQHSKTSNFITHQGVNKFFGVQAMSKLLNFDPVHCIGAGDTPMDTFLDGVGLSLHIGNPGLPFKGLVETIRLPGFPAFGDLLYQFAKWQLAFVKEQA